MFSLQFHSAMFKFRRRRRRRRRKEAEEEERKENMYIKLFAYYNSNNAYHELNRTEHHFILDLYSPYTKYTVSNIIDCHVWKKRKRKQNIQ